MRTMTTKGAGRGEEGRILSILAGTLAFLAVASSGTVLAGSTSATMSVSVTVRARALLSVDSQPASVTITEEDVSRGYVDVPGASRIQVRTNSPAGWLLEFQPMQGPFRSLDVTGLGSLAQVSAAGGWLAQPYAGKTLVTADLGYRFILSGDAQPGIYPWPVALSAIPR